MENETNKITEQIKRLAMSLKGFGCKDSFLDEIINQPEEPQGYQGYYFCYCYNVADAYVGYFNDIRTKKAEYYFTPSNGDCIFYGEFDNIGRKLTPLEIQSAILKGCEQKGIVKGAKVRCLRDGIIKSLTHGSISYVDGENYAYYMGALVFDNGKFAEVVKEQNFNCEKCNCKEQCNKCESSYLKEFTETKPSDKELLKECEVLLFKIESEDSCSSGINYKIRELLTKLNKHLNHE